MPIDPTQELVSLQDGKVPASRLQSAKAVRDMYERAVEHNRKREQRNAEVKGLVDGNPPYSQTKLRSSGQSYRANFNNGEAESYLNSAITAFYDLFSEVDRYATCSVPPEILESPKWTDQISQEFDWLVRQHDQFDYNVQLSIHDMVLYGMGPQVWEDELDWRPKAIQRANLILPDNARSNVCDWEKCFYRLDYRVDELYRFISDEEMARKAGWSVQAVKDAIMDAAEPVKNSYGTDWMKYQEWIRNNDLYAGEQSKVVRCAKIQYREFPKDGNEGKVSEAIVYLDSTDEDEFLFQATDQYDDWRQALCAFFYDRGDGTAHSVRGLGVKMYSLLKAKNRLQNSTVDAAFIRSAIGFRALGSGANAQQMAVANIGPFFVTPANFELLSISNANTLDATIGVARDLDGTLASNLGQYRARLDKPEGNPRTAFEVNAELQKQSMLGKTQIARFYQQLDEYYAEIFRRAISDRIPRTTKNKWLRLALEFQQRVTARGIPLEILGTCRVTARRANGNGSAYIRSLTLGNIFQSLYPVLPEDGKTNLVNDIVAANAGRDAVSRYNPAPELRPGEARQRWEAQVENDTLRNRGQVTITPEHNDVLHLQEHLAFASQAASSLQQGADPMDILSVLQAVGQHTAIHLQRLSQNVLREDEFKLLQKQWQQLAQLTDQLASQVEQMQQKQAEQAAMAQQAQSVANGTDPEMQLKAAEAQKKLEIKEMTAMGNLQLKAKKLAGDQMIAAQKLQQDLAVKDVTTASDIRLSAAKTAADIQTQKAKTNASER